MRFSHRSLLILKNYNVNASGFCLQVRGWIFIIKFRSLQETRLYRCFMLRGLSLFYRILACYRSSCLSKRESDSNFAPYWHLWQHLRWWKQNRSKIFDVFWHYKMSEFGRFGDREPTVSDLSNVHGTVSRFLLELLD